MAEEKGREIAPEDGEMSGNFATTVSVRSKRVAKAANKAAAAITNANGYRSSGLDLLQAHAPCTRRSAAPCAPRDRSISEANMLSWELTILP
ncbi:MAG: hypothetical protein JWN69_2605 [Alphaproteobacteria bacterium]|nr:hypothetical protein [Alphaproteobacteria bacterium]